MKVIKVIFSPEAEEVYKYLNEQAIKSKIEKELKKKGLSEEMIKLILKEELIDEFKHLYGIYIMPNLIAKMLVLFPKEISSKEKKNIEEVKEVLNEDVLIEILKRVKDKKISEMDVKDIMTDIVRGKDLGEALKVKKIDMIGGGVEEKIMKIVKSKPGLNPNAYMGLVMKDEKLRGIGGKKAMDVIRKFVK